VTFVPELHCETSVPLPESHVASGTKRLFTSPLAILDTSAAVLIGYTLASTEDQKLDL
jgi:hypothetical protein